jgi:CRISPR/Cas system Type II protein with McrA/HNH and RuvC-like nuclease domain
MQKVEPRLRFARLPDGQASDGQAKNQVRPDRSAQPSVPPHNGRSGPVSNIHLSVQSFVALHLSLAILRGLILQSVLRCYILWRCVLLHVIKQDDFLSQAQNKAPDQSDNLSSFISGLTFYF